MFDVFCYRYVFFFFKQKTAYEMRISDWSSDVGSSDLAGGDAERAVANIEKIGPAITPESLRAFAMAARRKLRQGDGSFARDHIRAVAQRVEVVSKTEVRIRGLRRELLRTLTAARSEEHTYELQSLMRRSYAVFC